MRPRALVPLCKGVPATCFRSCRRRFSPTNRQAGPTGPALVALESKGVGRSHQRNDCASFFFGVFVVVLRFAGAHTHAHSGAFLLAGNSNSPFHADKKRAQLVLVENQLKHENTHCHLFLFLFLFLSVHARTTRGALCCRPLCLRRPSQSV